ncbi:MAG: dTDP-glucose 4,6-dehydratase [Planctomycetota bacterium]
MQRILVTGGCGFIGANFIRLELQADPELAIINVDKLTYAGNLANLADVQCNSRYEFVRADICDRELIGSLLQSGNISAVINFAAETHVDRSIQDSSPFVRTNIVGTQTLLDCCRQYGVVRYLQVSTDEVYGSLGDSGKFTEETPLAPNSPYSASKAAADLLVRSYCQTFGFPAVITRCSNNYGPFQFPEKLIPLFITNAMRDQSLPVYGTGLNVRDWIHVSDHCRGIALAWRNGRSGDVYNFGGNSELTNLELTARLLSALEKPRSLIKFVPDRPGHDHRYAIDNSKAQRDLGWVPQVTFEAGLRETIAWYQSNPDWIAQVKSGEYQKFYERQYGTQA